MSPAFIKGVRDNLPKAKITFDKFHILKIINAGVATKQISHGCKMLFTIAPCLSLCCLNH
jgi:hypothetical protein